ncbi:MAG TPA: Tex family protein [Methanotrichaceae archaeon]|nr:Tex family protein [Methanotrichaceae archaeon]
MIGAHTSKVALELGLKESQVQAASELLDQDATVPFISRYRKEATGSLDEVAVAAIRDRIHQLREMDRRRDAMLRSLDERGLLTEELKDALMAAETMASMEDIYLPYRPKRRTRATIAREKGLEPLAMSIFAQGQMDPASEAAAFIDPEKGVESAEDALSGARDIIAEWINEEAEARSRMRDLFDAWAVIRSRSSPGKEAEGIKYKDYFDWSEPLKKAPSHRILAMMRGEKEGFLVLHIEPPEEMALPLLESLFIRGDGPASEQVVQAMQDSYQRLLLPSMETEMRSAYKDLADDKAITVFAQNLRQLLLDPPLGQKMLLAIDPGFRTGCKVVVLDRQGSLVHHDAIFPHEPQKKDFEAANTILGLIERFGVEAIAVGNGTAGRETESFLHKLKLPMDIPVIMVNESGASVYSASEVARNEFPDKDVTVRGAVSIGRRLMDPLAELVKIDPQAIGVGQYQHDVDPSALKKKLDDIVMSCVNWVGVDVNTASKELLTYISGLGPKLAESIVNYRSEHGPFRSRQELRKVPRLGPKAFEQAAGFLRIRDGKNPLDSSAVHPESYKIVDAMARDLGVSVIELMQSEALQKKVDPQKYVTDKVGLPTLSDIVSELSRPGRDPRQQFEAFSFAEGIEKIEDLRPGMKVPGIVTNVTAFGAFVDVGVHQDGLVHISQMADKFVRNPADVVRVHQRVMATVMDVDVDRKRISLSLRNTNRVENRGNNSNSK